MTVRLINKQSFYLFAVMFISGCSSLFTPDIDIVASENLSPGPIFTPEQANHHWQQQQALLKEIKHWQIMGKIGLFNADEAVSLNLFWQQMGDDYQIIMSNLFGSPVIEMKKQGDTLWLRIEQNQEYWGSDPQVLIRQLTGWQLPVNQMPQWLKGLPGDADYQLSNQGVVKTAQLSNELQWQLQYNQYHYWHSLLLPNKLLITSSDNKLKLLISDWKFKNKNPSNKVSNLE